MKICRLCQLAKVTTEFQKNRAVCKSCRKEQQTSWRLSQQERLNKKQREWSKQNPEKSQEIKKSWLQHNRDWAKAYFGIHRERLKKATPSWANLNLISNIYKNCPSGFEVDHIIPIKGKYVCGLHVETNLQYLPIGENRRKGNKFEGI